MLGHIYILLTIFQQAKIMRPVIYIAVIFLCWASYAFGQTPIQKQIRGSGQSPIAMEGYEVVRFASGLGEISALALDDGGSIYTLDENRGRVFKLNDRNKDGALDTSQIMASGFVRPKGLALLDGRLFVSDMTGLYEIDGTGRHLIASFQNVPDMAEASIIMGSVKGGHIIAVLNSRAEEARLIKIDIVSSRASLLAQGPGPITAIAQSSASDIWLGVAGSLLRVSSPRYNLEDGFDVSDGAEISGLLLPGQFPDIGEGFSRYEDHIFFSIGGEMQSEPVRQLHMINTRLGLPSGDSRSAVSGFSSKSGRTAWGYPGALIQDKRGIFFADKWSGTVWRLKTAPKRRVVIEPIVEPEAGEVEEVILAKSDIQKKHPLKSHIAGSQIEGSKIDTVSTLEVGSYILKEWEEKRRLEAEREKKDK